MKILIISAFFPPQNAIAAHRPLSWAKNWSELGHQIEVLTVDKGDELDISEKLNIDQDIEIYRVRPSFFFYWIKSFYYRFLKKDAKPELKKQKSTTTNSLKKSSLFANIRDYLFNLGLSTSTRMPDALDFWIRPAFKFIKEKNKTYDIVISTFGPYAPHIIAKKLKSQSLAKYWVADYRDLWTQNDVFKGLPLFKFIEEVLERSLIKKADLVTAISPPLVSKLREKFHLKNVEVIENGFDPNDLIGISDNNFFKDSNFINIVYTGSVYLQAESMHHIVNAFVQYPDDLINVRLHFYGSNYTGIENLINEKSIKNIILHSPVKRNQALQIQRDADALLFLDYPVKGDAGIFPGKVFEYLFNRPPIIIAGRKEKTQIAEIILKSGRGIFVGNNIQLIKEAFEKTVKAEDYSGNKEYINQFDRKNLAIKMIKQIEEVIVSRS